jgi:hypothetical protein
MDNYGLTMKGPFIAQPIANYTGLSYTSEDAGRIIFDQTTGKMIYGDSIIGAFRMLNDIPSQAIILFESNTQQLGYTLLTDQADGVVYYTDGNAPDVGGDPKVGGTWTQPGHAHTGPSHTHNAPQHQHDLSNHSHTVAAHAHTIYHTHTYSGNTSAVAAWNPRDEGGGSNTCADSTHYHNFSGTTSDVSSASSGNASPATGGPSYNATGNANAVTTDAAGTGSTSSTATANTWRPKGRNFTRQRRN